ncbi:hypothetical protein VSAK1_26505 [Vibrio mediterranei AK1]|uniref:hypothetical protein n=1 Tax=Vibrio mediterranei TaxID=689 RepID=UPI0001542817|nr:hypothetical protein [Vibrio mediterranei]EDL52179.1 hypothetical protein VSAK1_26505 [Vibrio mediterranei AK1]
MSQHTFQSKHYSILCGWDAPLQGFFLVIEDDAQDEPIYSNLNERNPHPKTFEPFLSVLENFNVCIHSELLEALDNDKKRNVGNEMVDWGTFDHLASDT